MVIKHNLSAMNADRMFGKTEKTKSKNMEKLSSGYKINRAADDAAGLSISEKMRRQIRGLTQRPPIPRKVFHWYRLPTVRWQKYMICSIGDRNCALRRQRGR